SSTLSDYASDPSFSFSPSTGGWAIGSNPTLTVTLYDANDNAVANHGGIDYQVSGVNTQGPSPATTNGSGQFTVAWSQSNAGDDTLYAWLDVNGNGIGPPGNDFGDPYSTHDLNFNNGSMSAYGGSFNAGDPYSATATLYNPDGSA